MTKKVNRRQFLRGSCGATLAIPFLPSLIKDAKAQQVEDPKFFVAMGYENGAIWGEHFYPDESSLTDNFQYAGRTVRHGDLVGNSVNGERVLSPALTASESLLTPALLAKLNVIRGMDIPWYFSHNSGGYLGNLAANNSASGKAIEIQEFPMRTIDQVMAYSDSFYTDMSSTVERSVALGNRQGMSWNHASPATMSGPMQTALNYRSDLFLFKSLFTPGERYFGISNHIVDKVLERYNTIRAHSGISAYDQQRLDQHMEHIFEIERKMGTLLSCDPNALSNGYTQPSPEMANDQYAHVHSNPGIDPAGWYWQAFNDVLAVAFSCGLTRIATMYFEASFSSYQGIWHEDIIHTATLAGTQPWLIEANRNIFELVFLDLAAKLDAIPTANGNTLLDNALLTWSQEAGQVTHYTYGLPIVTAGGAGGFFNTGKFIDYRNTDVLYDNGNVNYNDHPGLYWNQWLGTCMQAMGLDPFEYEDGVTGGYGYHYVDPENAADYTEAELVLSEPLPIIT